MDYKTIPRGREQSTHAHTNLDVISHNGDIFEVQSGIDLIHDVERSGFIMM